MSVGGTISTEYTYWCGGENCSEHQTFGSPFKVARKEARDYGWIHRKARGWICPVCAEELGVAKPTSVLKNHTDIYPDHLSNVEP